MISLIFIGYSQLKCYKCDDCKEIEMDTPSITCKITKDDSEKVPPKISFVTTKSTEIPIINNSTTPLPIKLTTTTTKIPSTIIVDIKPISVSSSNKNSSVAQSQPNSDMYLKKESVNYRKIEHVMVDDEIEYTCFKMDYEGKNSTKKKI